MFEVGDKVRRKPERLNTNWWSGGSKTFTVLEVNLPNIRIGPAACDWYFADYFDFAEPEQAPVSVRKVGDFSHEPTQRLTSETGASKGMRVTRHDLIPPAALREVAAVYGYGELKYPAGEDGPNWLRGMPFSWNERAALDHISQWREGVDFDTEDGVHHLAHAIWHFLAILEFEARGIGTDDRSYKDKPGGE